MTMIKDLSLNDLHKLANVLHEIGQLAFYTKEDEAIVYPSEDYLNSPPSSNTLSDEERRFFVFAIQEEKAVKILHEYTLGRREIPYRWTLEIDKPRFRELESEVKQLYIGDPKETTLKISNSESEEDYKAEIEMWLAGKSERTLRRMWRLVRALNYEWELRDQDRFPVPHDKFDREKISNANDQKIILTNLHNKKFISVFRKVGETLASDDPNKTSGSLWEPITDDPEIIHDAKTQIEIFPLKFKQLVSQLKELTTKKEANEAETQEHTKQSTEEIKSPLATDEIEWPQEFQWGSNARSFLLGDGKELNFGADKSDRKNIFESIANEKGGWTLIGTMAKDIGKSEGNVRTVINQLNDKIVSQNLQRYILIEPRGQTNKPGAYRIVPFPQGIKHH